MGVGLIGVGLMVGLMRGWIIREFDGGSELSE